MGRITEKRAKNGQFYQNAHLNGHARFKTGDFGTLGCPFGRGGAVKLWGLKDCSINELMN